MKPKRTAHFYVYKVTHKITGQFYVGSRKCYCEPQFDISYLGSMRSWKISDKDKRTFLTKEILRDDFADRRSAIEYEAYVIECNIENPLNENYHIPPNRFYNDGIVIVKDSQGNRMRVKTTDEKYTSGELIPYRQNTVHVIDNNGKTFFVEKNDERLMSGELLIKNKKCKGNIVTVKDDNGNLFKLYDYDPMYINGTFLDVKEIIVKDQYGELYSVSINDPRIASGELINRNSSKIKMCDENGNVFAVFKNDTRILSGKLIKIKTQ